MNINVPVMSNATKAVERVVLCLMWLCRTIDKSCEENNDDVTVMSSGLSQTGLRSCFFFLTKSLCHEPKVRSVKNVGIYQQ